MTDIYTLTGESSSGGAAITDPLGHVSPFRFRLSPGSVAEEVGQNLMVLFLVLRGTQPLERGLGMTWNQVDRPIQQVQVDVAMELYDQVDRYEPRAEIVSVSCRGDALTGKVVPEIKFRLKEGV